MKAKIHPKYYSDLHITCSCGNVIIAGSTKEKMHTEICSACHPFYTGQQKLLDTAGRVDKFMARVKKAQQLKEKSVKKIDKQLDDLFEEPADQLKKELTEQPHLLEFEESAVEEKAPKKTPSPKPEKKEKKSAAPKAEKKADDAEKPVAKKSVKKK